MRPIDEFDLGPYEKVAQSAIKAVLAEPLWTLLVLGWRRRPAHSRGVLLTMSILHMIACYRTLAALRKSPHLIQDRQWVERRSLEMLIRYLIYPAIMPPRSYWRGHTGDVAFFMQIWGPIGLWAGHGGLRASLRAGPILGMLAHLMAGYVNGEPVIPPAKVRQRILSYTGACVVAGGLAGLISRILHDAAAEMKREQYLHAQATAERAAAKEAEGVRSKGRADLRYALEHTREEIRTRLDAMDTTTLLKPIDDRLQAQWDELDVSSLEDLIHSTGLALGIKTSAAVDVEVTLTADVADFLRYVLEVCLDNTRRHGKCEHSSVQVIAKGGSLTMTVKDQGTGLTPNFRLQPGHGLTHANEYAELLGGSLTITNRPNGGVAVTVECQM